MVISVLKINLYSGYIYTYTSKTIYGVQQVIMLNIKETTSYFK